MLTIEQTMIVETAIDLIAAHPERDGFQALHSACVALGIKPTASTITALTDLEQDNNWRDDIFRKAENRIESLQRLLTEHGYRAAAVDAARKATP
jgi:hypothetical protein